MNWYLQEMPPSGPELATWLEPLLVGPDLGDLVVQLQVLRQPTLTPMTLAQVLGGDLDALLTSGLTALNNTQIEQLLSQPELLLELQELLFDAGGAYWQQLLQPTADELALLDRCRAKLSQALSDPAPTAMTNAPRPSDNKQAEESQALPEEPAPTPEAESPALPEAPAPTPETVPSAVHAQVWFWQRSWFVSMATAALVLVAVFWGQHAYVRWQSWGWNHPDLLSQQQDRSGYLVALADAADEFFQRPQTGPTSLQHALTDIRNGCTRLLSSHHAPLPPADQAWLMEKCVKWGTKLDTHLADLQTGKDWQVVRDQAQATVRQLSAALRKQAQV